MRLEVDMQPMRAAVPCGLGRAPHQIAGDAPPPEVGVYDGIEDEGMNAPVPGDIHKTDQAVIVVSTQMSEAPR